MAGQAGLVVPISGPYLGTWNGLALGTLSDDGYELIANIHGQEINESDAYGQTLVEGIYRGINYGMRIRGLEFNKTGLLTMLQQFGQGGTNLQLLPTLANIGDRWTKYCQSLMLTAILGNPPSMPQTLTALSAGLAPNSQIGPMLFTSKMREIPMQLVLLPYNTGSPAVAVPFTTT